MNTMLSQRDNSTVYTHSQHFSTERIDVAGCPNTVKQTCSGQITLIPDCLFIIKWITVVQIFKQVSLQQTCCQALNII